MAASYDRISEAQAQKAASTNKNFDAAWPAMTFGLRSASGLILSLYGGMYSNAGTPQLFDDVVLSLDDDSTCYVFFSEGSPAGVDFATSIPTDWPGPMTGMTALWLVTTAGGAITAVEPLRVMGSSSGGGGGGSIVVEEEGVAEVAGATILNFVGAPVTVVDSGGGRAAIAITSGLVIEQDGVEVNDFSPTLNFTDGLVATDAGGGVTEISATGGIPPGGTDGQVLTKQSDSDYDADWETPSGGGGGGGGYGFQEYTTGSGSWSVPADIAGPWVYVTMIGGGAGGRGAVDSDTYAGGYGGAAGQLFYRERYAVTPGGTVSWAVGAAGAAGPANSATPGGAGGDTTFGTLTALGGNAGTGATPNLGTSGAGGGITGGASSTNGTVTNGAQGTAQSLTIWGGGSGGAGGGNNPGLTGARAHIYPGGVGGAFVGGVGYGGAGGASSYFGQGGAGGDGGNPGNAPASTAYGAGGGGSGGYPAAGSQGGGAGIGGYLLIEWNLE